MGSVALGALAGSLRRCWVVGYLGHVAGRAIGRHIRTQRKLHYGSLSRSLAGEPGGALGPLEIPFTVFVLDVLTFGRFGCSGFVGGYLRLFAGFCGRVAAFLRTLCVRF